MNQSNESKNVCVIGMGNMGSTLAKALLVKGHNVTVWNRTVSKCESLGEGWRDHSGVRGGGHRVH